MKINKNTKIAALLKQHPEALETIITINPAFKKLRNPLLRKLMAGRTSIEMASKIGGVKPEDFFKALAPLGFEEDTAINNEEEKSERKPLPAYLTALKPHQIIVFDVREILAGGEDPLRDIQEKIKSLKADEALQIINTFEPVPLIALLGKQGFTSYVDHIDNERIDTYFYRLNGEQEVQLESNNEQKEDWDELMTRYENELVEIDVRHLEMPMPMMTILGALEELPASKALYVHHKRVPVFLLTELRDRDFDYRIKEIQEGEVYLLIFKTK
jgi:uncharacterized protein (DUF2249 family)